MSKRQERIAVNSQWISHPKTKEEKAAYKKQMQKQAKQRNRNGMSDDDMKPVSDDDAYSEDAMSDDGDREKGDSESDDSHEDEPEWRQREDGALRGPLKNLPTPASSDPSNPPIDILVRTLQRWNKDAAMTTKEKTKAVRSICTIWHPDKNLGSKQDMCNTVFQAMQEEIQRLLELRRRLKERHSEVMAERNAKREEKRVFHQNAKGRLNANGELVFDDVTGNQFTGTPIQNASQPWPRSHFAMCTDPNEVVHLFGGEWFDGKGYNTYGELYSYDGSWTELYEPIPGLAGPCARSGFTMLQCNGAFYLFGGEFTSRDRRRFKQFNDLWKYNLPNPNTGTQGYWEEISIRGAPTSRSGHRGCVVGHMLLLFGGFHERAVGALPQYSNDLYAYDTKAKKWIKDERPKTKGMRPEPRAGVNMWAGNQCCYIYGGTRPAKNNNIHAYEDLWKCTEEGWSGPFKTNGPKRQGMSSTSLSANKVVFYGGVSDDKNDKAVYHRDIVVLDLNENDLNQSTWTYVPVNQYAPQGRYAHQAAEKGHGLLIFGGACTYEEQERTLDDMWRFDFASGKWEQIVSLSEKAGEWFEEIADEEPPPPAPIPSLGVTTVSLICDINPATLSKKERAKWEKRNRQEVKKVKMGDKEQKKLEKKQAKLVKQKGGDKNNKENESDVDMMSD